MLEKWKSIPGYSEYEASNRGRVRHTHVLKPSGGKGKREYPNLLLCKGVKHLQKHFRVHDLVLLAFVGPKPSGHVVNHVDGNKKNNLLSNLQYITKRENYDHALKLGLYLKGSSLKGAKLHERDVPTIRSLYKNGVPVKDIMRRYAVTYGCIRSIIRGRSWRHINGYEDTINLDHRFKHGWSKRYLYCQFCKRKDIPYHGHGLCLKCYSRKHKKS